MKIQVLDIQVSSKFSRKSIAENHDIFRSAVIKHRVTFDGEPKSIPI